MGNVGASYYSNAYDYAEYPEAPVGGSQDLGDPSTAPLDDADLYTEIFASDFYDAPVAEAQQTHPTTEAELGELPEDPSSEESAQLKKQMQELRKQIEASPLPQQQKSEMLGQLDRAQTTLDISPNNYESVGGVVAEVQERYTRFSLIPKAALEISGRLGKDVEMVQAAAEQTGLDLEHLPHPPNAAVLSFLQMMGVTADSKADEYKLVREQRREAIKGVNTLLQMQYQAHLEDGSKDYHHADKQMKEAYSTRQDGEYQRMQALVSEMRTPLVTGLNALGYHTAIGSEPDQISVDGVTLDIFNEDTGSMTLDTGLTTLTADVNEKYVPPEIKPVDWGEVGLQVGFGAGGAVIGSVVGSVVGFGVFSPATSLAGAVIGAGIGATVGKWVDDTFFD